MGTGDEEIIVMECFAVRLVVVDGVAKVQCFAVALVVVDTVCITTVSLEHSIMRNVSNGTGLVDPNLHT